MTMNAPIPASFLAPAIDVETPCDLAYDLVYLAARAEGGAAAVLHALGRDPEDFVVTQDYGVLGTNFDAGIDDQHLGFVRVQRILLGAALNENVHGFDVVDSVSSDLCFIFGFMYGYGDEGEGSFPSLDPQFEAEMDYSGMDVTYLSTDSVLDQPWGPHVVRLLAQHSPDGYFVVGVSGLVNAEDAQTLKVGRARARKLTRMGFKRLYGSPFFFLNLSHNIPKLPKSLQLPSP